MKLPICCATIQNTASALVHLRLDAVLFHGETSDSPTADPNVKKTKLSAEASKAPAIAAAQDM
jgi:hypothetical protein